MKTHARPRNTDNRSLAPFWVVEFDNATDVLITTKLTNDAIANVAKATLEIATDCLEMLTLKKKGSSMMERRLGRYQSFGTKCWLVGLWFPPCSDCFFVGVVARKRGKPLITFPAVIDPLVILMVFAELMTCPVGSRGSALGGDLVKIKTNAILLAPHIRYDF